jgi:hypothetical protein
MDDDDAKDHREAEQRADDSPADFQESPADTGERAVPEADVQYTDDAYAAASKSMDDYSDYMPQLKPKRKWPKIVGWTLLGLILAAGLGIGGYWAAKHKLAEQPAKSTAKQSFQSSASSSQKNAGQTSANTNQAASSSPTKQYNSSNFKLSFSYPDGWTVADTGNGKLTATSPAMQLTAADGSSKTGEVIMSIQSQNSADMSMFKQGDAASVLSSQKVAYANPTSTQRAQTYLSFLQYAATTTHGALDGIYITGDYGYQKEQSIPESDINKIDPLIRVTFVSCATAGAKCTKTSPLSVSSDMWKTAGFSGPIENMLKSLAIQ